MGTGRKNLSDENRCNPPAGSAAPFTSNGSTPGDTPTNLSLLEPKTGHLPSEEAIDNQPHLRLYRTKGGPEFLRTLFSHLLDECGHTIYALAPRIIREGTKGSAEQRIKRWASGEQSLNPRDRQKELLWLRRLEQLMMMYPALRLRLETRSAQQTLLDAADGFATALKGQAHKSSDTELVELKDSIAGLYITIHAEESEYVGHDLLLRNLTGNRSSVSVSVSALFHYFCDVPNKAYMLAHEFILMRDNRFDSRRVGFAYPFPNGDVHRIMASCDRPTERTYDAMRPPKAAPRLLEPFKYNKCFEVSRIALGHDNSQILPIIGEQERWSTVSQAFYILDAETAVFDKVQQELENLNIGMAI